MYLYVQTNTSHKANVSDLGNQGSSEPGPHDSMTKIRKGPTNIGPFSLKLQFTFSIAKSVPSRADPARIPATSHWGRVPDPLWSRPVPRFLRLHPRLHQSQLLYRRPLLLRLPRPEPRRRRLSWLCWR